jgi:hypothetical protein
MDFHSSLLTLKSMPLPITLFTFCIFSKGESIPATIQTEEDLQRLLEHKYEYNEEQETTVTSAIFKKSLPAEFEKYFSFLVKICEGVYIGTFTTKNLLSEYVLVIKVIEGRRVKFCLSGNEYLLFDQLFDNLKFLLE